MIYVDSRVGSKELLPLFPKGSAELTHLDYADFMFTGHYEDGDIVIGIERKTIGDFVSCMCSGRFSGHQLIGLVNSYHYRYLIIEGIYRANPKNGILEVYRRGGWMEYTAGKRRFMARDIWKFITTIVVTCGFHPWYCPSKTDTVQYIRAQYGWWTKEYEEHKGHLQPHTGITVELSKQSLVRRWALQVDDVGSEMSKAIDLEFSSPVDFANTTQDRIEVLIYGKEGKRKRRIGKKLAASIVKQLRGE